MKNKNIIRIGDKVKIINPEVFVRCGYHLNKEIVKKDIIENNIDANLIISKLFQILDIKESEFLVSHFREKIVDELAYIYLKSHNFGGRERKIFTELKEKYRDCIGFVNCKKIVQTGLYNKSSYNYWDEEYEPAYLSKIKSHVILTICFDDEYFKDDSYIETEAKNVIKI